jgi:hypothetical protein
MSSGGFRPRLLSPMNHYVKNDISLCGLCAPHQMISRLPQICFR